VKLKTNKIFIKELREKNPKNKEKYKKYMKNLNKKGQRMKKRN
jgi:hypothetical protein